VLLLIVVKVVLVVLVVVAVNMAGDIVVVASMGKGMRVVL